MTFTPLFFLPRKARKWVYIQVISERLTDPPFGFIFLVASRHGISFHRRGDQVTWTWPWTRKGPNDRYVSLVYNTTFRTLKALDDEREVWLKEWERTCDALSDEDEITVELFNQPRQDSAIGRVV